MRLPDFPERLVGMLVRNHRGEPLGRATGVARNAGGVATHLLVREPGSMRTWRIEIEHIHEVRRRVHLKGPRQGFFVAPLDRGAVGDVRDRSRAVEVDDGSAVELDVEETRHDAPSKRT
ncbi:MAG: hypothetical protein ACYDCK_14730 [Thermoplasmatota archaeon]